MRDYSGDLDQGVSNLWCYGAHEEIDHNLRSPTINSKNKNKKNMLLLTIDVLEQIGSALFNDSDVFAAVIASLDSCKISQVSILISKRIARRAPRFLSRSPGAPYAAL